MHNYILPDYTLLLLKQQLTDIKCSNIYMGTSVKGASGEVITGSEKSEMKYFEGLLHVFDNKVADIQFWLGWCIK